METVQKVVSGMQQDYSGRFYFQVFNTQTRKLTQVFLDELQDEETGENAGITAPVQLRIIPNGKFFPAIDNPAEVRICIQKLNVKTGRWIKV